MAKLRPLLVDEQLWHYTIGKGYACLYPPQGKTIRVALDELTGRSWGRIERGRYKGTSDGMVTPADVARYVRQHLVSVAAQ